MFSQFDNEEVEGYFNRLNAPLKKMPPEDRAEMHQELRQHLDALVAAHMELGATEPQAVEAALYQLGSPRRIGRRLFQEWRISRQCKFQRQGRSILVECILFLALFLLGYVFLNSWYFVGSIYNMVLLPVLTGGTASLCSEGSAIKRTLRILLASLILITLYVSYAASGTANALLSIAEFFGLFAFCWLPLGGFSAWLAGKAKMRVDKHRAVTS